MWNPFFYRLLLTTMIGVLMLDAGAQEKDQVVRIARLQIDPAQLSKYNALLKEQMERAILIEPGVLKYFAVADKKNPSHITILEVYANEAAYKTHIEMAHFKKYKTATKDMVKHLELVDVDPIAFVTK